MSWGWLLVVDLTDGRLGARDGYCARWEVYERMRVPDCAGRRGVEAREMAFHSLGQVLPRQAPIYRPLRGTATSVPSPPALAGLSGATSRMRAYGQSFRAYVLRNDIVQFDNQATTTEVASPSLERVPKMC